MPQDDRLIEPPAVDGLMPASWWPWWMATALVLVLVLAALVLALAVWRRRRKAAGGGGSDAPRAHAKALAALAACPMDERANTATRVSLILRRYLAEVTGDPALYETHEQLVARSSALEALGDHVRQQTREFFDHLARLKYTPEESADEPPALRDDAARLLQALNREVAS